MSRETYSRKVYADCHFCNSDSECFARKGGKCQILDGQGKGASPLKSTLIIAVSKRNTSTT